MILPIDVFSSSKGGCDLTQDIFRVGFCCGALICGFGHCWADICTLNLGP